MVYYATTDAPKPTWGCHTLCFPLCASWQRRRALYKTPGHPARPQTNAKRRLCHTHVRVSTQDATQRNIAMCFFTVHPEKNAFWDMPFGASPAGIHLAAGPDRMHLLFEGLGQSLITWITAILVATGPA